MRLEMAKAKKETEFYLSKVERAHQLEKVQKAKVKTLITKFTYFILTSTISRLQKT